MPLYKPTELLEFLDSIGHRPNKRLSQNFLIDGNITRKIVEAAGVQAGDHVLEIGPGPGSLTEILLEKGAHVTAVETDFTLAEALKRLQTSNNRLTIVCADALKTPLEPILQKDKKIKLIANLPYHITTPLLARFVPLNEQISTIVVMIQNEVAERIVAKPGTADYSSLSIFLKFYSTVSYAFKVSRNCFYPAPKVDSAVIRLDLKKPLSDINPEAFFTLTRSAFGQRRKTIRNTLKDLYATEAILQALSQMGLPATSRAEELSLDQFVTLYRLLN